MAKLTIPFINNLEGQLLIATPSLKGSLFEKSVIYVCDHNQGGAMGIVVNNAVNNIKYNDILDQLGVETIESPYSIPVHIGGPVDSARGFILHTNDYESDGTKKISNNVAITSTTDILEDIANGFGPNKSFVALGYAGWESGQLDEEIKENSWITMPANEAIIFGNDNHTKWNQSINSLGINSLNFSAVAGHG